MTTIVMIIMTTTMINRKKMIMMMTRIACRTILNRDEKRLWGSCAVGVVLCICFAMLFLRPLFHYPRYTCILFGMDIFSPWSSSLLFGSSLWIIFKPGKIAYNRTPLCNRPSGIYVLIGFSEKRHRVGKFSAKLSLSVRSLFCLFKTYTNDIYWVCKTRTGEATNWPGKINNFTRYQGA